MNFLILLSTFFILSAQKSITIFHNGTNTKLAAFEKELILYVSSLYRQKTKSISKIKLIPVINLAEHLSALANYHINPDTLFVSINILSKTKKRSRSFDLTIPYMPNIYCILGLNSKNAAVKTCGYIKGSTHDDILKYAGTRYQFRAYDKFTKRMNDFKDGKIDYILSEYVDIWNYNLKLVEILEKAPKDQFVVLLTKNNPYNKEFINTFNYYVKSQAYFKLIKKHFGSSAVNYFKKNK